MAPTKTSGKAAPVSTHAILTGQPCNLPVWNDDQILQENWGTLPLSAVATNTPPPTGKDAARPPRSTTRDSGPGSSFSDAEGREVMTAMMEQFYVLDDPTGVVRSANLASSSSKTVAEADAAAAAAAAVEDAAHATKPAPMPTSKPAAANATKSKVKEKTNTSTSPATTGTLTKSPAEHDATTHTTKEENTCIELPVTWCRAAEVVQPFRPMVHLNQTPYVDPYMSIDGAAERVICTVQVVTAAERADSANGAHNTSSASTPALETAEVSNSPSSSSSKAHKLPHATSTDTANTTTTRQVHGAGDHSHSTRPNVSRKGKEVVEDGTPEMDVTTLRRHYPEVVTPVEELRNGDLAHWRQLPPDAAIRRYRALAPLMNPYDPTLIRGCAERPMELCEQRYSTAQRHKLAEVEALAALSYTPPFLMRAFHSVLLVLAQTPMLATRPSNNNGSSVLPPGFYLWELIYPHAPGTHHPIYNPNGKYAVKLFVEGAYRKVIVDDLLPVDALGRAIIGGVTGRRELWPALLAKALLKAWGPKAGPRMLCREPERVMAALLGNWMPEYVAARERHAGATWALYLMRYAAVTQRVGCDLTEQTTHEEKEKGENRVEEGETRRSAPTPPDARRRRRAGGEAVVPVTESPEAGRLLPSAGEERETEWWSRRTWMLCALRLSPPPHSDAGCMCDARDKAAESTVAQATDATQNPPPSANMSHETTTLLTGQPDTPAAATLHRMCGNRAEAEKGSRKDEDARDSDCNATLADATPQLFAILAVRPFRQTFAVLVESAPPDPHLHPSAILTRESSARDVQSLLSYGDHMALAGVSGSHAAGSHDSDGGKTSALAMKCCYTNHMNNNTVTTAVGQASTWRCRVWLTLEELMTAMDGLMVWRRLDQDYCYAVTVRAEPNAAGREAAQKNLVKTNVSPPPLPLLHTTTTTTTPSTRRDSSLTEPTYVRVCWCAVTCTQAAELAVVCYTPYGEEEKSRSSSTPTPTSTSRRIVCGRVQLDYYDWQRAEPLSRAATMVYPGGRVRALCLPLVAGRHLFRLTVPGMSAQDRVMLLSHAELHLFDDLIEAQRAQQIYSLIDTGVYPAVAASEEDYVWFKRRLHVSVPTRLTMVLTTLPASEDGSAHRYLSPSLAPPVGASNKKNAGSGSNNNGSSHNKSRPRSPSLARGRANSPTTAGNAALLSVSREATGEELDDRVCAVSILHHVKLACIDLDRHVRVATGTRTRSASDPTHASHWDSPDAAAHATEPNKPPMMRVGAFGRLVQMDLRPNEQGYLVMAYARVPAMDEARIERGFVLPGTAVPTNAEAMTNAALSPVAPSASASSSLPSVVPPLQSTHPSVKTGKTVGASADAVSPSLLPRSTTSPSHDGYPRLYGAGQWRLTVRGDAEVSGFEMLTPNLTTLQAEGALSRGGGCTVFRYACTVTEPTHVSMRVDWMTAVPAMPLRVMVVQLRTPPPTPQGSSIRAAAGSSSGASLTHKNPDNSTHSSNKLGNHNHAATGGTNSGNRSNSSSSSTTGGQTATTTTTTAAVDYLCGDAASLSVLAADASDVLYDHTDVVGHRFVPSLFLDPPDDPNTKAGSVYLIEGLVPAAQAEDWEEACRQAQAARFANLLHTVQTEVEGGEGGLSGDSSPLPHTSNTSAPLGSAARTAEGQVSDTIRVSGQLSTHSTRADAPAGGAMDSDARAAAAAVVSLASVRHEDRHASMPGPHKTRGPSHLSRTNTGNHTSDVNGQHGSSSSSSTMTSNNSEVGVTADVPQSPSMVAATKRRQKLDEPDEALAVRYRLQLQLSSSKATVRNVLLDAEADALYSAAAVLSSAPCVDTAHTAASVVTGRAAAAAVSNTNASPLTRPTCSWQQAFAALHQSAAACAGGESVSATALPLVAGGTESTTRVTGAVSSYAHTRGVCVANLSSAAGDGAASANYNHGPSWAGGRGAAGGHGSKQQQPQQTHNQVQQQQQQQQQTLSSAQAVPAPSLHRDALGSEDESRQDAQAYASRDRFFADPTQQRRRNRPLYGKDGRTGSLGGLAGTAAAAMSVSSLTTSPTASTNSTHVYSSGNAVTTRARESGGRGAGGGGGGGGGGTAMLSPARRGHVSVLPAAAAASDGDARLTTTTPATTTTTTTTSQHNHSTPPRGAATLGGGALADGSRALTSPHRMTSALDEEDSIGRWSEEKQMTAWAYYCQAPLPRERYTVYNVPPTRASVSLCASEEASVESDSAAKTGVTEAVAGGGCEHAYGWAKRGATGAVSSDEVAAAVRESLMGYTKQVDNGVRAMFQSQQEKFEEMKTRIQELNVSLLET